MNEAIICDRYRPLIIYSIIKKGNLSNVIFITEKEFADNFNLSLFKSVITYRVSRCNIYFLKILINKLNLLMTKLKNRNELENINYVFGQRHILGMGLVKSDITVLEDGLQDYTYKKNCKDTIREIIYRLPSIKSQRIREYIITGINDIPDNIKKPKIVELKNEWNKLNEFEKDKIMNLFNFSIDQLEGLSNSVLIVTQPLSEDGIIKEEIKKKIYKILVEKNVSRRVLIKPHPRDNTDYSFVKKQAVIIDKRFPLEFAMLLGIKPLKIATLFSTIAYEFKNLGCDVEWYGRNFLDDKLFRGIEDIH